MKTMSFALILLLMAEIIPANADSFQEVALISSIDDYDDEKNYVEVSEEGLPTDHYLQLLEQISAFRFTVVSANKINEFFQDLTRDSRARMSQPAGSCSQRRTYIQNKLSAKDIISGKILIKCPANNGRLRLQDQVSGRFYSYSNFHDTNIVTVNTEAGVSFRVLDVQFQKRPVSLQDYLTEIENSQRIRPAKRRGTTRSLCYWTISTPFKTF